MHPAGKPASGLMQFMRSEDGISFIECALLASLVAVVVSIALLAASKGF